MLKIMVQIAKTLAIAMLVCVMTIYTSWAAVQTYLDSLLENIPFAMSGKKVEFTDFMANLVEPLHTLSSKERLDDRTTQKGASAGTNARTNVSSADSQSTTSGLSPLNGKIDSMETSHEPGSSPESPTADGDKAKQTMSDFVHEQAGVSGVLEQDQKMNAEISKGQTDSNSTRQQIALGDQAKQQSKVNQKELVLSTDEFMMKKDLISEKDKMNIFLLIAKRVPPADLQKMSNMMEDGITESELKGIETMIHERLKENEIQELMTIIAKY